MAKHDRRHDVARKRVVLELPGMDRVTIRRDVPYQSTDAGPLTMDLYCPDARRGERRPAVVFVSGYSDAGAERIIGCRFKDMESFVSWGRLAAVSTLVGVTYATGPNPDQDLRRLFRHLGEHGPSLGIDANRIGVWACSGHAPNALSLLMYPEDRDRVRCAVFCYSFLLDLDGTSAVAAASRTFGFVNPVAGRQVEDLASDVPLLIVRAGRDELAGVNEAIDRFTVRALRLNLRVTIVNHAAARHGFDVLDDSPESRKMIDDILRFLRCHLSTTCIDRDWSR